MYHPMVPVLIGVLTAILGSSASPVAQPGTHEREHVRDDNLVAVPVLDTAEPMSRPLSAQDMTWISNYLRQLLHEDPWSDNQVPLLYVETPSDLEVADDVTDVSGGLEKRSRYYRRYPWKRVNSRSRNAYDPDAHLCNPSREDVFQLLLALHEAREGNASRTINFCNRRRPASAVFTNIRFIGRRK